MAVRGALAGKWTFGLTLILEAVVVLEVELLLKLEVAVQQESVAV